MTKPRLAFAKSMFAACFLGFSLHAFAADPPKITMQPKDHMVSDQSAAAFTVKAEGATELSYQWYRNSAAIAGATNATLSLSSVTFTDSGAKFHVVVIAHADGAPTSIKSAEATLKVVSPSEAITHRYSFAKDATDSVGHADGTLQGTAIIADGKVKFDGTRGTYVDLPGGLIAGNDAVTFEFWVDLGENRSWARVFDQGSTNGGSGQHDLYFCPRSPQDFRLTIMDPHPRERRVEIKGNLDNQTNIHVACVLDPTVGLMAIYTNGVLAGSTNGLTSLGSVDTNLFFLGRSLFRSDPPLNGAIDEFRIYKVALSAPVIAASYKNGPNANISAEAPGRK